MEEYLTKKVNTNDIDDFIKLEEIFDYQLVRKDVQGYKSTLVFKRETETPYYQEIVALEKSWQKEMDVPAWPTYVLIGISILIITAYLIVSILNGFEQKLVFFLSIMVPGLVFFILGSIYFFIRSKKIQKIIEIYYERRRDYSLKAKEIKEKKR